MDNDFGFILLQIYVNTDDEYIIDTINTLLDNETIDSINFVKSLDTRYNEKSQDNSDEEPRNTFDSFDWSDIELQPTYLPSWVEHELNTHIPPEVKDGDIVPRYIGDFIYDVKYINKSSLEYVIVYIKRIKGTKHND